jgi:hypothetical protein
LLILKKIIWQPYAKVSDDLAAILVKMVRYNYCDRPSSKAIAIIKTNLGNLIT